MGTACLPHSQSCDSLEWKDQHGCGDWGEGRVSPPTEVPAHIHKIEGQVRLALKPAADELWMSWVHFQEDASRWGRNGSAQLGKAGPAFLGCPSWEGWRQNDAQGRPSTYWEGRRLLRSDSGDTPSIPRVLQEPRCQGQDVGNDVHALLPTVQG